MYSLKSFIPPALEVSILESMRAPPDRTDDFGGVDSSDEEGVAIREAIGAFPGTERDYDGPGGNNYY